MVQIQQTKQQGPICFTEKQRKQLAILRYFHDKFAISENILMRMLYGTAMFPIQSYANHILAGTMCPYGTPPTNIVREFDSERNMYWKCLHGPNRHCWSFDGKAINCPI